MKDSDGLGVGSETLSCRIKIASLTIAAGIVFSAAILCSGPAVGAESSDAKRLYAQHCARCHADAGTGNGPAHTMQRPWPRDFTAGQYKFRSTPAGTLPLVSDVERVIAKGIPRTSMSGYDKWLTPAEIRLLAEYVLDFSEGSGVPDGSDRAVKPPADLSDPSAVLAQVSDAPNRRSFAAERLARGKQVFAANCVSCHGGDGRGLGDLAGQLRDKDGFWTNPVDLTDALGYGGGSRAADIYRTITTGIAGSPMPIFDKLLDEKARADVAAYVESLQVAPKDRTLVKREVWNRTLTAAVRGEYLVRAMSCALCHNSYDASGAYYTRPYLAGGVAITIPGLGVFPTRNITSHPEDGLGGWTEEQIVKAITTGHAPDRRIEAFSMPWVYFSHLTDQDARDIAAYVKSLAPISNRVPDRRYDPVWKRLWTRIRQLVGLELGRLEYPPFNVGSRKTEAERLESLAEQTERLRRRTQAARGESTPHESASDGSVRNGSEGVSS